MSEINKIVDDAENHAINNGFVLEFEVARDYVGRIVGSGGAGVNKIRDDLGVDLDFSDEPEKAADGKKKKASTALAKIKVRFRFEETTLSAILR